MMPVDLEVIKDDLTTWNRGGKTYYFTDRWVRKYPDEAKKYYGFVPTRKHRPGDEAIKVYYTQDGELIISNCRDNRLQNKIRIYMDNWYRWKREQYIKKKTFRYPVSVLARAYTSPINDEFCQIRFEESVCNIEKSRLENMTCMLYIYTYPELEFEVETGLETLDRLVLKAAKKHYDSEEWPALTPKEWEKYYYPGVEECFVPGFGIPFNDLEYNAWQEYQLFGLPDIEELKKQLNRAKEIHSDNTDSMDC